MKLVVVLSLLVAFSCCAGVIADAKPGIIFEEIRLRILGKRLGVLQALAGVTSTPVPTSTAAALTKTTPSSTTPMSTTVSVVTPSAALATAAAAEGISLAALEALTPDELAQLEALVAAGLFK